MDIKEWEKFPAPLKNFIEKSEKEIKLNDHDSFWNQYESFKSIINNRLLWPEIVNQLVLKRLIEHPSETPILWQEHSLELYHGARQDGTRQGKFELRFSSNKFSVSDNVQNYEDQSSHLTGAGKNVMLGFLGTGITSVNRYKLADGFDFNIYHPDMHIEMIETVQCNPGDVLKVDGENELIFVEDLPDEVSLVVLASPPVVCQQCVFDKETKTILGASLSSDYSSRLSVMLDLVDRFEYVKAESEVAHLLSHHEHYIRWSAIKTISALNGKKGRECIKNALNDPHPHNQDAARRTLELMEQS